MARINMREASMQLEARPIANGATRFLVQHPDGAVYDITGVITNFELTIERPDYGLEFGGRYIAGPMEQSMTIEVQCSSVRRMGGFTPRGVATEYNSGGLGGNYVPREGTGVAGVVNEARRQLDVRPAVDADEFRHEYQNNPEEPGICAVSDCGMWPEHHDHIRQHARQRRCVCSGCMPDSNDLPDDQHWVDARTSETTMHPGPETARSHP